MQHQISTKELADLNFVRETNKEYTRMSVTDSEDISHNFHGVASVFNDINDERGQYAEFTTASGRQIENNDGETIALHLLESLDQAGYRIVRKG